MRGDRPSSALYDLGSLTFTPHARGSTRTEVFFHVFLYVYPACAGIDPALSYGYRSHDSLPRMRGDRPRLGQGCTGTTTFTPHARGSTSDSGGTTRVTIVYPACAGIDLGSAKDSNSIHSLPRMRGDRPKEKAAMSGREEFTPHARGSTFFPDFIIHQLNVYPACAGIDLPTRTPATSGESLPRMRGDRPLIRSYSYKIRRFTPHARGSTVPGAYQKQN